jgi:predicted site-specific integrase-resolvase
VTLLKPKEAAAELGVCLQVLMRHVANGDLPYVLIGSGTQRKARRFAPEDLEKFKDKQRRYEAPITVVESQRRRRQPNEIYDFAARLAERRGPPPTKPARGRK